MSDKISNLLVFDFESGGLDCTKHAAAQIALLSFRADNFEEISRYVSYIKPYNNLEYQKAAMDYNGITMDQIYSGKDVKVVVKELIEQFKIANTANSARKKPILAGQNVKFDIGFLEYIFKYCGEDLYKYVEKEVSLCTMWFGRIAWADKVDTMKYNLEALCTKAGIDLFDAHDAMNDVVATAKLLKHFLSGMKSGNVVEHKEERFRTKFQF